MSSIKLKHSGGNSVSIAAPASNPTADRTVTLPSTDVDGVITTKDSNDRLQSVTGANGGQFANRNIFINGEMQIAQRGTSKSGLTNSNEVQAVDRMFCRLRGSVGTWTISQSTDAPAGFGTSLKWDCTTARTSPHATDDFAYIQQRIEGRNVQQLKKGTSEAEKITVSFYVKSNKTGNFALRVNDADNSRSIGATYTINSANTWERKTMTFAGDTSGTLDNDNNQSFNVLWWMVIGSGRTSGTLPTSWTSQVTADEAVGQNVNMADSTDNEFLITGIQLELGEVATDFEHRLFGRDLADCQRYMYRVQDRMVGKGQNASDMYNPRLDHPVEMRASPTLSNGSFTTHSGSNGSPVIGNTRFVGGGGTLSVALHNGSNNWSNGAWVKLTGDISAEL